jgi:hypothetical protein
MYNRTGLAVLIAIIGVVALADPGAADVRIEGAVQYPPPSIGEDAQPPPPARMVPKIVLPRRLQLGPGGSGLAPVNHHGGDWLPMQTAPLSGGTPVPFSIVSGNN